MSKKNEIESQEETTLKSAAEIALENSMRSSSSENPISSKELEELKVQAAKAQEHWERLLRTQADLENYRKRMARERQDLVKTANEKLLLDLLAPLDHFEMGLQSVQNLPKDDSLLQGMKMILVQFQQFLKAQGVVEIQAMDQMFDPSLHEAVAHHESDQPEGKVIQQLRKGYRLHDKLLRPATVIVSKARAAEGDSVPTESSEVS